MKRIEIIMSKINKNIDKWKLILGRITLFIIVWTYYTVNPLIFRFYNLDFSIIFKIIISIILCSFIERCLKK